LIPADVYLPDHESNINYSIDVAVTYPFYGTFKMDLQAVERYASDVKEKKYGFMFKGTRNKYLPVVFDTFGGLNDDGERFMKDIIKRNEESKGRFSSATLWRKLLHILYTNNTRMVLRRMEGCRILV